MLPEKRKLLFAWKHSVRGRANGAPEGGISTMNDPILVHFEPRRVVGNAVC